MAAKSSTVAQTEEPAAPQPGEVCPCCGRKVPANAKTAMSPEEKKERQKEYNERPDVKAKRKAYNARRNEELRELRRLQRELAAQDEARGEEGDE